MITIALLAYQLKISMDRDVSECLFFMMSL